MDTDTTLLTLEASEVVYQDEKRYLLTDDTNTAQICAELLGEEQQPTEYYTYTVYGSDSLTSENIVRARTYSNSPIPMGDLSSITQWYLERKGIDTGQKQRGYIETAQQAIMHIPHPTVWVDPFSNTHYSMLICEGHRIAYSNAQVRITVDLTRDYYITNEHLKHFIPIGKIEAPLLELKYFTLSFNLANRLINGPIQELPDDWQQSYILQLVKKFLQNTSKT